MAEVTTVGKRTSTQAGDDSARSMPVLLFAVAEACTRGDLPVPYRVGAVRGHEIVNVDFRSVADFDRWCSALGVTSRSCHAVDDDGTPSVVTNAHTYWLGWWVALSCLVPADGPAVQAAA
jgi:hypothetical protein